MTKLLKKYYATQKKYRNEKMRSKFEDVRSWSKSLNEELEKILACMNIDELNYLLENTSGMFSAVIKDYLDKALQKNTAKKKVKNNSSELAVSICV